MKQCSKCKLDKLVEEFSKNKATKDGRQTRCKACKAAYYTNNKKEIIAYQTAYYASHKKEKAAYYTNNKKEIIAKQSAYNASHKKENAAYNAAYNASHKKEKAAYDAAYKRNRYSTDPNYKMAKLLRNRLRQAFKGCYKAGSAVRDLGCTIEELFAYFEPLFEPGMNRQNLGTAWQIDHIIPLASFDLTNREELLKACHYTNLQPLTPAENLAKGDKLDWDHEAYTQSKI